MSNFTLLGCLELVKKFSVVVVGGGGWWSKVSLVFCFGPTWAWTWTLTKLNKIVDNLFPSFTDRQPYTH